MSVTTQTVTTDDGVALHVVVDDHAEAAPDAPVLLLANSLGTDLTMWAPQLEVWTRTHRVVRFDQRGHGRSQVPTPPFTLERLGADAVAVLDALGIESADVCGLSLGGLVALQVAVTAPDRVRRLVVSCTAARVGTEEAWAERAEAVRAGGMAAVTDLVLERFFSPAFRASGDASVDDVATMLSTTDPDGYAGSCLALAVADLHARLGEVVAPTLVIAGGADVATPPEQGGELAAAIPGAELIVLDGAGHLANLESPDAYARAVRDHLAPGVPA